MRVQDLMSQPVVTCHVNDPLNLVAQKMWDHDCGAIAIVNDEGKLTGMITDRDICMAALTQGRPLDQILVNNVMSNHVVSASPDLRVTDVEQLMVEHQVQRIPIVDPDNRPVGIVSIHDLAIESVQPDSRIKNGAVKIAHTLAAICRPRIQKRRSA
jgi:CBS domain-containing protein